MKIGIVTFHNARNHGAVLQAYALQQVLRQFGHEPFLIDYQYGIYRTSGLRRWLGKTPSSTLWKWHTLKRSKAFMTFCKKYLVTSPRQYWNYIELSADPPNADVYICGSDQIWNPDFIKDLGDEKVFWLAFGPDHAKRMAYGASFGRSHLGPEIIERYCRYAQRFEAISVREQSALDLVRQLGRDDAVWVPDPTILLSGEYYREVEQIVKFDTSPHLFSYQLEGDPVVLAKIGQVNKIICKELGLVLYESHSISPIYNFLHNRYINPGQWLYMLRRSSFVCTNSFHGTIFSILFCKPFIVLPREGGPTERAMICRVLSLLDIVGLRDRLLENYDHDAIKRLCHKRVPWDRVGQKIAEFRQTGLDFLNEHLNLRN